MKRLKEKPQTGNQSNGLLQMTMTALSMQRFVFPGLHYAGLPGITWVTSCSSRLNSV